MARYRKFLANAMLMALAALLLLSCKSGGGGGGDVRIVSINLNPEIAVAGTVVELTASISAPGQSIGDLTKNWSVSAGFVTTTAPEFGLLVRETAQGGGSAVSTTRSSVYWTVPATAGQATITLAVGGDSESRTVSVGDSPLTLSVSTTGDGNKLCTIRANEVNDLFFAAFRVNYSGGWNPVTATRGDFLGGDSDTLFLGLTNQAGFVPVAVSRTGSAAGADGSGVLATVEFAPASTTSAANSIDYGEPDRPFELEGALLVTSAGPEIKTPF
jgi:hypothetical protein